VREAVGLLSHSTLDGTDIQHLSTPGTEFTSDSVDWPGDALYITDRFDGLYVGRLEAEEIERLLGPFGRAHGVAANLRAFVP